MSAAVLPASELKRIVGRMKEQTVLVVGDSMLDEYCWGDSSRISPEAPVPVVTVKKTTCKPGGAANVACNLHALGVTPCFTSLCGDDWAGEKLRDRLHDYQIDTSGLFVSKTRPTTLKTRIIARNQQMLRTDREERTPLNKDPEQILLLTHIKSCLADCTAVIVSDYGKGVCTDELLAAIAGLCREHHVPFFVDPKRDAFTAYAKADCITPNSREALRAANRHHIAGTLEELIDAGRRIISELNLPHLVVTCGEQGVLHFCGESGEARPIPAHAKQVFDVTGAGDTFIAVYGAARAAGASSFDAAAVANRAAGLAVGEPGTATVTPEELTAVL